MSEQEIDEENKKYLELKRSSPLWKNNKECPNCGKPANPLIYSCETGMDYCSAECASEHVNRNAPEGGY